MFWECAHVETGEAAAAFWTGARVNAVPRLGWVKVKSFLEESFQTINCESSTAAVLSASSTEAAGAVGALGPAWTRGEIEAPQGEKSMGSWTAAVYTAEQQARLSVDEVGRPTTRRAAPTPTKVRVRVGVRVRVKARAKARVGVGIGVRVRVRLPTPTSAPPRAQSPRSNDAPPSLWQRVQASVQAKVLGLLRLR